MAKRDDIVEFCNDYLDLHSFKDYGPMGLQLKGAEDVKKIVVGVSINQQLIDGARQAGAQMIIVHHGLFWNNEPRYLDARMNRRLTSLEAANISVLGYHLALDAHPNIGNNRSALDGFDGKLRKFGDIGWGKKLDRPFRRTDLRLRETYKDWEPSGVLPCAPVAAYLHGPTQIRKVAAVVGGAPFYIHDAVREGYDLFITGEAAEPSQSLAEELGINFLALGHYNSEKSGVKNLAALIENYVNIETEFLDIPNPV